MINIDDWEMTPDITMNDRKMLCENVKRRKDSHNKSQYIRGLSYELLHSDNPILNRKGVALMLEMIEQYSDAKYVVMTGHLILGDYYKSVSDYQNALDHYKIVMENNHSSNCTMHVGLPEMDIASTIIKMKQNNEYDYARDVMSYINPRTLFIEREKQEYRSIMCELNTDND